MAPVTWTSDLYEIRLTRPCRAPAEVVYDALADLRSHAAWGGREQAPTSRIRSFAAPEGPATVGTEFESTGNILAGRTRDRSTVTAATRPTLFEFTTEGSIARWLGKPSSGTWVHRFEIEPRDGGSVVTYTFRRTRFENKPLWARIPGVRGLAHRRVIPWSIAKGFMNLIRHAEERAGRT